MPRDKAEGNAYDEYVKRQRLQAAAHHLAGMKAAHAGGDQETARKHSLMYKLHSEALGNEPVGPVHPDVAAQESAYKMKFRPHKGDLYALEKKKAPEDTVSGEAQPVAKAEVDMLRTIYTAASVLAKGNFHGQFGFGTCSGCGKRAAIRPDGMVGCHDDKRDKNVIKVCAGGMKKPKDEAVEKGEVVGKIGNAAGAEKQPKKLQGPTDFGIARARKWAKENGYADLSKEPTKKGEMQPKAKVKPCVCPSYAFPHRHKSGKCGGK
jgi:hypothetical protein